MKYQYAQDKNYQKFASGRVLYNLAGSTSFPVRLLDEIWCRTKKMLEDLGNKSPYSIYDPCCGIGYMMTILGFLHGRDLSSITLSDIDIKSLEYAEKNLSLLSHLGLEKRIQQIEKHITKYDKDSHKGALLDAIEIKDISVPLIKVKLFSNDIFNNFYKESRYDVIMFDAPYGNSKSRKGEVNTMSLFSTFKEILNNDGILIIVSDKKQKFPSKVLSQLTSFTLGKRKIRFYGHKK